MAAFEPVINLLVLLSALSVAAERLANALKLGNPKARGSRRNASRAAEKERERRINLAVLRVSLILAFLVKADFFAILSHLEAPWETLGWVRPAAEGWLKSPALASWSRFLYAAAGTMLTGAAMGFGSTFWHDVLDIVYRARHAVPPRAPARPAPNSRR
jgi:hypothetical protein